MRLIVTRCDLAIGQQREHAVARTHKFTRTIIFQRDAARQQRVLRAEQRGQSCPRPRLFLNIIGDSGFGPDNEAGGDAGGARHRLQLAEIDRIKSRHVLVLLPDIGLHDTDEGLLRQAQVEVRLRDRHRQAWQ